MGERMAKVLRGLSELLREERSGACGASAERAPSRSLLRAQLGAATVSGMLQATVLVGGLYAVMAVGDAATLAERVQSGADSGVFAEVSMHARGLNFIGLVNIVMSAMMAIVAALQAIIDLCTLAIAIASAICAGCGPWCGFCCGICPAISPLESVKSTVEGIKDAVEEPIKEIVRVTDKVNKSLAVVIPGAGTGKLVKQVTPAFAPASGVTFTWPAFAKLPVKVLDLNDLCKRGGDEAGKVMSYPFESLPLPGFIKRIITRALKAFARMSAMRLCAMIPMPTITIPSPPGLLTFDYKIWKPVETTVTARLSSYQLIQYVASLFSSNEAPMDVEDDAERGGEPFQVRALVVGNKQTLEEKFKAMRWMTRFTGASIGRDVERAQRLANLGRVVFSQGESYYDGDEDREEWLVNMKWANRLRRFRLPRTLIRESADSACRQWGGGGMCDGLDDVLDRFGRAWAQ